MKNLMCRLHKIGDVINYMNGKRKHGGTSKIFNAKIKECFRKYWNLM